MIPKLGSVLVLLFLTISAVAQSSTNAIYQSWLDNDVRWIINADERDAFQALNSDAERDRFVVQFWERRDPTPGTARNEFKEEHYRRIAYANTHFGSKIPGSLTARGEIYIKFGPPDEIAHGDRRARQATSFVSSISKPPTQVWIYESPHSVRRFKFVDNCECGEYELVKEPPLYQDIWP